MIKASSKGNKHTIEISGEYTKVRDEMLHIGGAVRKIPDQDKRDELVLAFIMGALGDPGVLKDKPDFDELIHSNQEDEE